MHLNPMRVAAIITAGGFGARMGAGRPKQYLEVAGLPIIVRTLRRFAASPRISEVMIVVPPEDVAGFAALYLVPYGLPLHWRVVPGGETRQQSVLNGLNAVPPDVDIVVIHDAVRPFVSDDIIERSIDAAHAHGACVVAMPLKETVKRVGDGMDVGETVDRTVLWGAQTPQAFRLSLILDAYRKAQESGFMGTDDAMLVERLGKSVKIVEGDYHNIKITTKEDLAIAEAMSKGCG